MRDPNEPEIRWLLEAGIRTLDRTLLDTRPPDGSMAYSSANGLFETMSLDRVMQAFRQMCRDAGVDPGSANKARIIRRWGFAAHYQLDLVAYLFRTAVNEARVEGVRRELEPLLPQWTFGELVETLLRAEATSASDAHLVRLQLLFRFMFSEDEVIRGYVRTESVSTVDLWAPVYESIMRHYGLGEMPRRGTVRDLASALAFIAEGAFAGRTAEGEAGTLSDGSPLTLMLARATLSHFFDRPWEELAGLPYSAG